MASAFAAKLPNQREITQMEKKAMAKVFISYSHVKEDEAWKDRVVSHLSVLKGKGLDILEDRRIGGGDDWEKKIQEDIQSCNYALLLVSTHFLNSKYIQEKEIPPLLGRRQKDGIRIVPVILSSCLWEEIDWLKALNARPEDGKPLDDLDKTKDANAALTCLAKEFVGWLDERKTARAAQPASTPDEAPPDPDAPAPRFGLQKELEDLLPGIWQEKEWGTFLAGFNNAPNAQAFCVSLAAEEAPNNTLLRLQSALIRTLGPSDEALQSNQVAHAITLAALMLYERDCAIRNPGDAGIRATNLLFAAVQAAARRGAAVVVKEEDARDKTVSNRPFHPKGFHPYRKDATDDAKWEEIKRSLSLSAELILEHRGLISYQRLRERFNTREETLSKRYPTVTDAELRDKLQEVERRLGGQFVYYVGKDEEGHLALDYSAAIEQRFGVKTVVWTEAQEGQGLEGRMQTIFELLYSANSTATS